MGCVGGSASKGISVWVSSVAVVLAMGRLFLIG